jgi:hypothetical protein
MIENDLKTALASIAGGRCYPDTAPDGATFPLLIYQQVGGRAYEYVNQSLPDHDHARVQVVTWAKTRPEASEIMRSARVAILAAITPAQTYGAPIALYNDDLKLYGCRQDFGIWFKP